MKKSFIRSILFAFLLALSVCACLYVNLSAVNTVSSGESVDTEQNDYLQDTEETDVSIIEVELLKKIIQQGASNLPTSDI
ncbi:MAG: hypothetical protein AB8G11_12645 [Saprospiraceae bacterium]